MLSRIEGATGYPSQSAAQAAFTHLAPEPHQNVAGQIFAFDHGELRVVFQSKLVTMNHRQQIRGRVLWLQLLKRTVALPKSIHQGGITAECTTALVRDLSWMSHRIPISAFNGRICSLVDAPQRPSNRY
ncbi:hypothetical protein RB4220 [Rhodopirellula baltica SH 1]|uniref:Uncharacterized protein n=1 Tax=Rhodopirellula baltica (strain DSM 10527 / NCIMB 13988 / SH1) TaxID=243090 RepID=Q7USZ0_RHOBA|nr:hypothetical protein RB4220 [Rhodopirellula baltica SH 1]